MNEVIQKIDEVYNVKVGSSIMDGYKIITDKQEILFLISNYDDCCEQWGYFSTNDNLDEFTGATLLKINSVDLDSNVEEILLKDHVGFSNMEDGGVVFVNIETSNGTFQLAVYNAHNGYYGHSVLFKSNQETFETGV